VAVSEIKPRSLVCSAHFSTNSFKVKEGGNRILRQDAVPTVFNQNKELAPGLDDNADASPSTSGAQASPSSQEFQLLQPVSGHNLVHFQGDNQFFLLFKVPGNLSAHVTTPVTTPAAWSGEYQQWLGIEHKILVPKGSVD
jgi:hypothetical protein